MPVSLSRATTAGRGGRGLILRSDRVSCMYHIWGCYLCPGGPPCPTPYVSAGWDLGSVGSRCPIVLTPSRARTLALLSDFCSVSARASKRKPQKCKPKEYIKGERIELLENQAGVTHAGATPNRAAEPACRTPTLYFPAPDATVGSTETTSTEGCRSPWPMSPSHPHAL